MPNSIKYSTTGDTLSIKKGNFYFGVGDVGKGPSETTGYYQGISPPSNGYTIYPNASGTFTAIYCPNNDTQLINFTNGFSNQTFTSATECLNWYMTQSGYACVNRDYESIATNGLTVNIDAGFTGSYSTSGNTWYDTSYNSNNATLFNTPTYTSGYLNFSKSSSEYATIPNIGTIQNWTVEVWVRFTSSLSNQVSMVLGNQYNLSTSINFTIGTNRAPSSYNIVAGFFQSGWYNTTGFAPTLNTWYQIVGTYDGSTITQYVNGNASGGTQSVTATLQSGGEIRIMRRWDDVVSSGNLFDGDLAIGRVYNRVLNPAEILQNFNAQKSRFGL